MKRSSILRCVAPQRQLKNTYRFCDFFPDNFVIGISWLENYKQPLAYATLLFMLYVTQDPGDCNVGFLEFALVAGCLSIFTVIIGLACKIMVEDAWADGTLTRKDNIVVWLMINSHYAMLLSQVSISFAFFIYTAVTYRNITYWDIESDYYCTFKITKSTYVISAIFFASSLFATLLIIAFRVFKGNGGGKDDGI